MCTCTRKIENKHNGNGEKHNLCIHLCVNKQFVEAEHINKVLSPRFPGIVCAPKTP